MNKKITFHFEEMKASLVNESYKYEPYFGVRLQVPDKNVKKIKYISDTPIQNPSNKNSVYENEFCKLVINTGSQSNDLLIFLPSRKENDELSKQTLIDCLDSLNPQIEGKQIEVNFFYVK